MKRLRNLPPRLLAAALCLAISATPRRATGQNPDNPPVNCGTCECYDLEDVDLMAGGTKVKGDNSAPTDCTKVSPDPEGKISLSIPNLPTEPTSECEDCDDVSLTKWIRDSRGREAEMPTEIITSDWASPVTITIQGTRSDTSGISICRTFVICFSPCDTACSSCSAGSPSASGSDNPSGAMGSVNLEIPVGKSNFGDSFAILSLRLDDPENPGRKALNLLAWDDIPKTEDGSGITGVFTQSATARIKTIGGSDPNAYTISISHDPLHPDETVFRTVTIMSPSPTVLTATIEAFGHTRVMTWSRDATGSSWTFTDANGMRKIEQTTTFDTAWQCRTERSESEMDPDSTPSSPVYLLTSRVTTAYMKYGGWWQKVSEMVFTDPAADGQELMSRWEYYDEGEVTGPASYTGVGRLKHYHRHDGYYEFHTYFQDSDKKVHHIIEMPYSSSQMVRTIIWNPATNELDTTDRYQGTVQIARTKMFLGSYQHAALRYTSATDNLATSTDFYPAGVPGLSGRPRKITHEDGTVTTYAYAVNGVDEFVITEESGAFNGSIVVEGTRRVSKLNSDGIMTEEAVTAIANGSANGITLDHWRVTAADDFGRPLTTTWFPTFSSTWDTTKTYSCCGLESETDKFGILTQYQHDAFGRRIRTNRLGVTEAVKYEGLTVSSYRYAEIVTGGLFAAGLTNEISRSVSYLGGTVTESWGPSPQTGALVNLSTRTTTYSNPESGTPVNLGTGIGSKVVTQVIQVAQDGTVPPKQSELHYRDGKLFRTWGDLEPAMQMIHLAETTGSYSTRCYLEGTITSDGTGGTEREHANDYRDHAGRNYRNFQPGREDTRFYYNALGQLERTMDADDVNTRYAYNTKGERTVTARKLNATIDSITWGTDNITEVKTFPAHHPSSNIEVNRTTSVWKNGNTGDVGFPVSSTDQSTDGVTTWHTTPDGETVTTVTRTGVGDWTVETFHPDETRTLQTYIDGLWDKTEFKDTNNSTVYSTSARQANNARGYDPLNRLTHVKDSRNRVTITTYVSAISDQIANVIEPAPGNRTTAYTYDHRGRRILVDAPNTLDSNNATLNNFTETKYFPNGSIKEITGDQTYRTSYTHDYAGRTKTLTTYRTTSSTADTSTTTWSYYPTSGLLHTKKDHVNKGVTYTYTNAGRPLTRTWHRGVSTTYGHTFGRLTSVIYSDATPDIAYTYDSLNRTTTVTQANQSQISYAYDPENLALDTETIQYDLDHNGSYEFTRVLDRNPTDLGRNTGYELLDDIGMIEAKANYDYDPLTGRIQTVDDGGLDQHIDANNLFTYTYVPNSTSNLIQTVSGGKSHVTNTWATDRDILELKENKIGTYNFSSYDYTVNALGQRTAVNASGNAFWGNERDRTWGYDFIGQLTVENDLVNNAYDRGFAFDRSGNRTASIAGNTNPAAAGAITYTPNALNQYEAITDPASSIITPLYDDDGNVTTSSIRPTGMPGTATQTSNFTWDAENRIVEIKQPNNTLIASYKYDAFGRRIATTRSSYPTLVVRIYDGWNPIVNYYGQYPMDIYLWGLDVSGSLQGAGGVGGLLAVSMPGFETFYPTYDGNGNVSECIATNFGIDVHYEYDAFGNVINTSGWFSQYFPFRFSTKQQDDESGLLYYGFRPYDPLTGRWPSRDPIGERGGINLYGFIKNDGVGGVDYLGLTSSHSSDTEPGKCCDDAAMTEGEKTLNDRYKKLASGMKERGTPRGRHEAVHSCVTLNGEVLDNLAANPDGNGDISLSGIPKCWDCKLENRRRPNKTRWTYEIKDHWVVICTFTDSDGNNTKEISFDYWNKNAIPGEDPDNYFRQMYPDPGLPDDNRAQLHQTCTPNSPTLK